MTEHVYEDLNYTEEVSRRKQLAIDLDTYVNSKDVEGANTNRDGGNRNTTQNLQPQHTGGDMTKSRCYRVTTVCVLLLCVLLLTAVIVLWIKYNTMNTEKDQLQARYHNVTTERDLFRSAFVALQKRVKAGWIYYNSSIYYISNGWRNWTYSRQYCTENGADLLIINSLEEQTFIRKVLCNQTWIGLSYTGREGKWKWVDNTTLTTSFWGSGKPNNNTGGEDCVMTSGFSGLLSNWDEYPCNSTFKFMCEKTLI